MKLSITRGSVGHRARSSWIALALLASGLPVAAHPGHGLAGSDVRHLVTNADHLAWLGGISLALFLGGAWLARARQGGRHKDSGAGNAA